MGGPCNVKSRGGSSLSTSAAIVFGTVIPPLFMCRRLGWGKLALILSIGALIYAVYVHGLLRATMMEMLNNQRSMRAFQEEMIQSLMMYRDTTLAEVEFRLDQEDLLNDENRKKENVVIWSSASPKEAPSTSVKIAEETNENNDNQVYEDDEEEQERKDDMEIRRMLSEVQGENENYPCDDVIEEQSEGDEGEGKDDDDGKGEGECEGENEDEGKDEVEGEYEAKGEGDCEKDCNDENVDAKEKEERKEMQEYDKSKNDPDSNECKNDTHVAEHEKNELFKMKVQDLRKLAATMNVEYKYLNKEALIKAILNARV